MLGIIIGVASVVLMTSVGESMEGLILGQISSIGTNSMILFPGQQHGSEGSIQAGFDSITFQDYEALKKLKTVRSIAPAIIMSVDKATYKSESTEPRVIGTVPNYFNNREMDLAAGRILEDRDVASARNVVVLGSEVADELFGIEDPLDKRIKFDNRSYTVIGVFEEIGTQFFQNVDEMVFVPLSTARAASNQKFLNVITMQAAGDFDVAVEDVKSLMRRRHGIDNPEDDQDKDDFIVSTSEQANDILGTVSLALTFFITTIASISLVVGGIGIMNIMLVAVTERTREIGLRKAVGARRYDILFQFLIEAILLTTLAGLIGLLVGVGAAALAAAIADKFLEAYDFAISVRSMLAALAMAFVTGLGFGMYPAKKASELDPISALRYE